MIYSIDAKGKRLGRLATEIAIILQGKKHPTYEPRLEGKDRVVVKNIVMMEVTGLKKTQKKYYRHTTQIGHLKSERMEEVWEKKGPQEVLRRAVYNMLPKNRLRDKRMKRLMME